MALGDTAPKDAFFELWHIDHGAAEFVSHFWHTKAEAALLDAKNELTDRYARKITANPKQKVMIERELVSDHQMLLIGYYYDHAPEIRAMIEMRLKLAREGKSSTRMKSDGQNKPILTR